MGTFELEGKTYIAVGQVNGKFSLCTGCAFEDNTRLCDLAPIGCTSEDIVYHEAGIEGKVSVKRLNKINIVW